VLISGRTGNFSGCLSRVRARRVKSVLAGLLTLCAFSLSLSASCAARDSTEAAQDRIRAALEKWTIDFNARNSSQVCSLFAPDLVSNYQGQPEGNYDSLCARLKRSLDDPAKAYHYDLHIDEILVAGDLAVVRLKWTLKIRREKVSQKKAPNDLTIEEPGLDVFRRQPDGTWKIARYMSYPAATPCPASAP
jgi:ketosteroid isomerase-like protein